MKLKIISFCFFIVSNIFFPLSFISCTEDFDYVFTNYSTNFTINNSIYFDQTLASSLNPMSPGIFTIIKCIYNEGGYFYIFENNHGMRSIKPFTAIDFRMKNFSHIGMNNGLIVGYGILDYPFQLFVYDLQCPNCFNSRITSCQNYSLSINSMGVAKCWVCHREYGLNYGGNVINGIKGRPLYRYRATSTGIFGILHVH